MLVKFLIPLSLSRELEGMGVHVGHPRSPTSTPRAVLRPHKQKINAASTGWIYEWIPFFWRKTSVPKLQGVFLLDGLDVPLDCCCTKWAYQFVFEPKKEQVPLEVFRGYSWRTILSKQIENHRMDLCRDNACKDLSTAGMRRIHSSMYTNNIYIYDMYVCMYVCK